MPNSLEDFLGKGNIPNDENLPEIQGGFRCQECDEAINVAKFDENESKVIWKCSQGHRSEVTL
jgi:hypothetical protein